MVSKELEPKSPIRTIQNLFSIKIKKIQEQLRTRNTGKDIVIMYKSKLQEVCQQRRWSMPEYNSTRSGLDHSPSFSATVTVNGLAFSSTQIFRSSKDAQNDAAKLAFHHFSNTPQIATFSNPNTSIPTIPIPSPCSFPQPTLPGDHPPIFSSELPSTLGTDLNSTDDVQVAQQTFQPMNQETHQTPWVLCTRSEEIQHLYKNQLQTYAQKRNLLLPVYSSEQEGPPHASRFKSRVTIDGQTFEGQEFLSTMKDAEHAAAKAALISLLPTGVHEDDSGLYKNLLQELLQKEGCSVPVYVTHISGPVHMPIFVSTVEILGETFRGQEARSKKLAEMSAAKVAYHIFRERKSSQIPLLLTSAQQEQEASMILSSSFQSNLSASLQQLKSNDPMILIPYTTKEQTKENTVVGEGKSHHHITVSSGPSAPTTSGGFSSSDVVHGRAHEETKTTSLHVSQNGSSSTLPSDCSTNLCADFNVEPPAKRSMYNKVSVYPRTPNMQFPEGTTVLSMSNEKWVALSHT